MSYTNRIPPIKVVLNKTNFNKLLEFLSKIENDNNNCCKNAKITIEKLLKYSIPFESEENEQMVDIRFYVNEATQILTMLINNYFQDEESADYFSILLRVRESLKKDLNNNKE